MKIFALILAFTGLTITGFSQVILIENGTVTTCSGTFYDDGNDPNTGEGGPYGTGASYTFTICPDNPGDVITVEFSAFQLYTSPNPNNSDYLAIFDGDNTGAPSLGSYTGNDLQGLPVTGTVNNTSGCLTFTFSSNPNGGGSSPGWQGEIACTTPCATPTSASEIIDPAPQGPEQSIGVCLGADITFGDIGSFAEPGFNLEYWVWNFDDGTIDTLETPDNITHAFSEPGEYLVSLSVIDDNGCRSLNLDPLQILVSTIPIFNPNFESPVCIGSGATLDGNPVESVTWTALPPQVVAGETFLADGAGFSYSSTLTFDFFEPGATLDNCEDLEQVFVNMEHSFLGDLQISLTCPNGTNVILLPYPNGGGGTYLGEAIDDGGNDPGVGYDYGWAPGQTNGNLPDQGAPGATPVPPGIYQSEEDMCNFVGCPLNGDWTFSVVDNLAIDNGYIFEWGIDFNPLLFPDITTFTPIIGYGSDSTFWDGPNIVSVSDDANTIEVLFDQPGTYEYTFFSTNNFGCTFDTTVVIEAIEGPEITAGPDLTVCNDPVPLQAGIANSSASCANASGNYVYCYENNQVLTQTFCPDVPGDGVTFMEVIINAGSTENFFDEFWVYDGDNNGAPLLAGPLFGDLSGLSFQATNSTGCITIEITPDGSVSCGSGSQTELDITVSCGGGSGLIWSWSPPDGLSDPNIQNPTVLVDQATTYTVSAFPVGFPGCVITDQVTVAPDAESDPGLDTDTTLCYNSPTIPLIDYLGGNPAPGGDWIETVSGNPFDPSSFAPTDYPNGGNFNYTYTVTNGVCTNSSNLIINILPATDETCCQVNANAGPDAVACALSYQLNAEPTIGLGSWSGPPEVSFSDINDPQAIATAVSPGGTYILTWTDSNGFQCEAVDEIEVIFADSLTINAVPSDAICFDECSGTAVAIAGGGTADNGLYSFEWSGGTQGIVNQVRDSLCAGTYSLIVTDNVGCTDSTTFSVGQPMEQDITLLGEPPLCADSCNGRVTVNSPGAVEYSYDGGITFSSDNVGFSCAGQVFVVARNEAGCEIKDDVILSNPEPFIADFNINPNPTTVKNTLITFQDVSRPGPIDKTLFLYGDPPFDEGTDRISQFVFPKDTAGEYLITLISQSVNGCIDTTTQVLVINDDLLWFIPNSFSPNGDGINDIWKPVGNSVDLSSYSCKIYDRWGRLVFETADIDEGWRGNVDDSEYFSGASVFTYVIEITSATTEEKEEITGFITLIR